jgi:uncharacterized protein (TIGR00296 family)
MRLVHVFSTISLLLIVSCTPTPPVFISDRHSGSYDHFLREAKEGETYTLILLDYHHDMGPGPELFDGTPKREDVKSFNWVGALVNMGIIEKVYWVSGRDLLLPNRESREAWLNRILADDPPDMANKKAVSVEIIDWPELLDIMSSNTFKTPLALSLDLDIMTVDPGEEPDLFLDEMLDFIVTNNFKILTVSLSSAYQKDAPSGWKWLTATIEAISKKYPLLIEGGIYRPKPESNEEISSWSTWDEEKKRIDYSSYFAPGAELWDWAPYSLWKSLMGKDISAQDASMTEFLNRLDSSLKDHEEMANLYDTNKLTGLSKIASQELEKEVRIQRSGDIPYMNPVLEENLGVAVRFINGYEDRGCIAYYSGVEDLDNTVRTATKQAAFQDPRYESIRLEEMDNLDIEVSIFGEFQPISTGWDFVPGVDTLILEYQEERTLLQASLAAERNLSRNQFLETLIRKAGLEEKAGQQEDMKFFRAPTVYLRVPLREDHIDK